MASDGADSGLVVDCAFEPAAEDLVLEDHRGQFLDAAVIEASRS